MGYAAQRWCKAQEARRLLRGSYSASPLLVLDAGVGGLEISCLGLPKPPSLRLVLEAPQRPVAEPFGLIWKQMALVELGTLFFDKNPAHEPHLLRLFQLGVWLRERATQIMVAYLRATYAALALLLALLLSLLLVRALPQADHTARYEVDYSPPRPPPLVVIPTIQTNAPNARL